MVDDWNSARASSIVDGTVCEGVVSALISTCLVSRKNQVCFGLAEDHACIRMLQKAHLSLDVST